MRLDIFKPFYAVRRALRHRNKTSLRMGIMAAAIAPVWVLAPHHGQAKETFNPYNGYTEDMIGDYDQFGRQARMLVYHIPDGAVTWGNYLIASGHSGMGSGLDNANDHVPDEGAISTGFYKLEMDNSYGGGMDHAMHLTRLNGADPWGRGGFEFHNYRGGTWGCIGVPYDQLLYIVWLRNTGRIDRLLVVDTPASVPLYASDDLHTANAQVASIKILADAKAKAEFSIRFKRAVATVKQQVSSAFKMATSTIQKHIEIERQRQIDNLRQVIMAADIHKDSGFIHARNPIKMHERPVDNIDVNKNRAPMRMNIAMIPPAILPGSSIVPRPRQIDLDHVVSHYLNNENAAKILAQGLNYTSMKSKIRLISKEENGQKVIYVDHNFENKRAFRIKLTQTANGFDLVAGNEILVRAHMDRDGKLDAKGLNKEEKSELRRLLGDTLNILYGLTEDESGKIGLWGTVRQAGNIQKENILKSAAFMDRRMQSQTNAERKRVRLQTAIKAANKIVATPKKNAVPVSSENEISDDETARKKALWNAVVRRDAYRANSGRKLAA